MGVPGGGKNGQKRQSQKIKVRITSKELAECDELGVKGGMYPAGKNRKPKGGHQSSERGGGRLRGPRLYTTHIDRNLYGLEA